MSISWLDKENIGSIIFLWFIYRNGCIKNFISNFIKKETLAQLFSCEICVIFKNTIFTGHVWATASEIHMRSLE